MATPGLYRVFLDKGAQREIKSLEKNVRLLLEAALNALPQNPFPPNSKSLSHFYGCRRLRFAGDWRALYYVWPESRIIVVLCVGHRREIYRRREKVEQRLHTWSGI